MMITVNANTKIATVIKAHPDALEAIVSLSPKFNKLRNPILRKIMAPRVTIASASKIGNCTVEDFFQKLRDLGFTVDESVAPEESSALSTHILSMEIIQNTAPEHIHTLDVRPMIADNKDPLTTVMAAARQLQPEEILLLVNTFEPIPLIEMFSKKGYLHHVIHVTDHEVNTYFYKSNEVQEIPVPQVNTADDWEDCYNRHASKMQTVDVRDLEMPLPMITILEQLDNLPSDHALFVYHKKVPMFLLPELEERGYQYRIQEIEEHQVRLLIFKS